MDPAPLLVQFAHLFTPESLPGPVLDLACGNCANGIFLALRGLTVDCCDLSAQNLENAARLARGEGVSVALRQADLEVPGTNPLPENTFGAVLVFRYLHRPLIPCIRKALRNEGILIYETFTMEQPRFGKPRNPDFLLRAGELAEWYSDWETIHYFEGILKDPDRAVAQIVCRKPQAPRPFPI